MPNHGETRQIGRPFKKGEGGRPPGTKNKRPSFLKDLYDIYISKGGKQYLRRWAEESRFNERRFIEAILAAALKEMAEKHEHAGADGGPITFNVTWNGNH